MTNDITNTADLIDVRDIIARFEELETELESAKDGESVQSEEMQLDAWIDGLDIEKHTFREAIEEYKSLKDMLAELCGNGGDEQWRGDWYPITLVRDSYFEEHAQEIAEDCGMVNRDAKWPNNCIDWEEAADQLKGDYAAFEYGDITYWYR